MNGIHAVMMRKVRGVRVVDIACATFLVLIVLSVYASKAGAGAEGARIADTTRQIATEEQQVRVLRAEAAYLTQPERLRRLSAQYLSMGPVPFSHDVTPETLLQLRQLPPPPSPPPAPSSAPAAEVSPQAPPQAANR
jgi:hypothetical protein